MSKSRIKELAEKIVQARLNYYNDQPKVSDMAYDAWSDELRTLEPRHPALIAVGAPVVSSAWLKAKHQIPMGSLNKVNTPDELIDWAKDKSCKCWMVVEKLDGLSIECIYEDGKLIDGVTRGDGKIGESILANVVRMQGVNSSLKTNFTGSLRGEIIMTKSIHQKFFSNKANARNAASGVSKRLDGVDVDKLTILFYQVLGDIDFETEVEQFKWLEKNNIGVPNWWIFGSIDLVNKHWREYQDKHRDNLDWDIDGLVVRINDLASQMSWGDKDLRPLAAVAFKFDNEDCESILRKVVYQTGNSGRITPVAVVDPVILVGASIERASLYNMAYINELGLDIGATVLVARCNDVIPKILEVVKGTGTVIKAPMECPACGGQVKMDGENLMCLNVEKCPAQLKGRLLNWINELNLLEWGITLVDKLVETGKATTVADLYTLTVDNLASIDRMGKKSAQKCYDILHSNNEVSLEVFLGGLSIPMIGQSTIKAIMSTGCDSLEKFAQLTAAEFEKVPGVGPTKAESLAKGLKNNQQLISELLANGVKIKEKIMGNLSEKSFVFTGKMMNKRAELEEMVVNAGGTTKSSVTKGVTYLVIADPESTSSKAVKARELGTKLISEEDFLEMVK